MSKIISTASDAASYADRWVQSWLSAGWGLPSSGTVQIGGSLAAIAAPSVGNGM